MSAVLIDTSCYIHEIPLSIYRVVCCQLDQNECWQRLAHYIGYDKTVIEQLKQTQPSPATKLLSLWSDQNHTVTELFMALYAIKESRIMEQLRGLVEKSYHRLITTTKSKSTSKHRASATSTAASVHLDTSKSGSKRIDNIFSGIPKITTAELAEATNQWSSKKILGSGGYGTVYCGKWKATKVAVKRINCHGFDENDTKKKQLRQIMVEMRFLNEHRHDNILPLYGYSTSSDGSTTCLVYQMMVNGSLDRRLRNKALRLTYKQRLNIAIGTARGLLFLHTFHKRPTVHGDIKSANILLDANLQPKIGDFGLARHTSGTTKAKQTYGTHAYMARDFCENLIISTKNDVFSFGVVLFELATGYRPYDERRGSYALLSKYIWAFNETPERFGDLVDSKVKSQSPNAASVLLQLIKIGLQCTQSLANNRPEMSDVLTSLMAI